MGNIIGREVADKQVMTVRINGGTREQPVPDNLRLVPALGDHAAQELTDLGIQIELLYGMPMDIEWARLDGEFAIVQARPITALPVAEIAPPTDWPMPDPKGQYMRTSLVDLLPDPVSPLFATLGIPSAKIGVTRAGRHLTHSEPVFADDYFTTINYYAYMNSCLSNPDLVVDYLSPAAILSTNVARDGLILEGRSSSILQVSGR